MAIDITSTRFGTVQIESGDIILFPQGILGMEDCREWVLLADAQNEAIGWLQNTQRSHVALAVVSPRRFVPGYQIRVSRRDLSPLDLVHVPDAQVLVVVGKNDRAMTLNLKAPLLFNLTKRLGCQVVAKDPHPIQHEVADESVPLRKTA